MDQNEEAKRILQTCGAVQKYIMELTGLSVETLFPKGLIPPFASEFKVKNQTYDLTLDIVPARSLCDIKAIDSKVVREHMAETINLATKFYAGAVAALDVPDYLKKSRLVCSPNSTLVAFVPGEHLAKYRDWPTHIGFILKVQ